MQVFLTNINKLDSLINQSAKYLCVVYVVCFSIAMLGMCVVSQPFFVYFDFLHKYVDAKIIFICCGGVAFYPKT